MPPASIGENPRLRMSGLEAWRNRQRRWYRIHYPQGPRPEPDDTQLEADRVDGDGGGGPQDRPDHDVGREVLGRCQAQTSDRSGGNEGQVLLRPSLWSMLRKYDVPRANEVDA